MSSYFILASYTDQGIRNIKDSPKRVEAARELARSMGVEFKEFYLAMGAYDIVVKVEAPSDEVLARLVLALGSRGNVRTTTLRVFDEGAFRDIVGKLP